MRRLLFLLPLFAAAVGAVTPETDVTGDAWCGLPDNDPASLGLPSATVEASAGMTGITDALNQLKCRGTLYIGPGVWTGDDSVKKDAPVIKNTNKGDLACNITVAGVPDANGKLPELRGFILRGGDKRHGCLRFKHLRMGAPEIDGGPNLAITNQPTLFSLVDVHMANRPRLIMDRHPDQTYRRKGWAEDRIAGTPPVTFVEIIDSSLENCATGQGGRHHCAYLEMPGSFVFMQNSTIGPADWTAFRSLANTWVRHSTIVGGSEAQAGILKGSNLVEQLGCANSLYEHNTFDTGGFLTGAHPVNVIGRRSYGGCLDVDYPAPLLPGYYAAIAKGGLDNVGNPRLKRHVFRDNTFINRNANSLKDGQLKRGFSAIEVEASNHELALNSFGRSVYVATPPDYVDPVTVWLDSSNRFTGWTGTNGLQDLSIEQAAVGRQPAPADLMRCKGAEPETVETLAEGAATGYRMTGNGLPDGTTCRPWDYAAYPVDRLGERALPGPRVLRADAAAVTPAQLFGAHPLLAHWQDLADRFDCAAGRKE